MTIRRLFRAFLVILLAFLVRSPLHSPIYPSYWVTVEKHVATGVASYYGDESDGFLGRTMASGRVLTNTMLVAAHRTLPFGTKLRVTNLENGLAVVVTVADRGPFIAGRVIDLSAAAAEAIDLKLGTVRITRDVQERVEYERW